MGEGQLHSNKYLGSLALSNQFGGFSPKATVAHLVASGLPSDKIERHQRKAVEMVTALLPVTLQVVTHVALAEGPTPQATSSE